MSDIIGVSFPPFFSPLNRREVFISFDEYKSQALWFLNWFNSVTLSNLSISPIKLYRACRRIFTSKPSISIDFLLTCARRCGTESISSKHVYCVYQRELTAPTVRDLAQIHVQSQSICNAVALSVSRAVCYSPARDVEPSFNSRQTKDYWIVWVKIRGMFFRLWKVWAYITVG